MKTKSYEYDVKQAENIFLRSMEKLMYQRVIDALAIEIKDKETKFYRDAKQAVLNSLSENLEGRFWYATVGIYKDEKPYEFMNIVISKEKPENIKTLKNEIKYQKFELPSRPKIIYGEHIEIEIEDINMVLTTFGWEFITGEKITNVEKYCLGDIINGDYKEFESLEEAKKALKDEEEDYEKRILEEEEEINSLREQGYEVKDSTPASEFFYIKRIKKTFDKEGDIEEEIEDILVDY